LNLPDSRAENEFLVTLFSAENNNNKKTIRFAGNSKEKRLQSIEIKQEINQMF